MSKHSGKQTKHSEEGSEQIVNHSMKTGEQEQTLTV